jgi:tetratricopeptide (TPR) repeat protein
MKINEAFILNLAEDHEAAFDALCTAMKLYRQMKLRLEPWPKALIDQGLAEAYLGRGELAKARRRAECVIALGEGDVLPDALRTLGEVELATGRLPDAERQILASLELARASDPYLAAYALRALARVYRAMNDPERARAASDEAIAIFLSINLPNEVERTQRVIALSNPQTLQ